MSSRDSKGFFGSLFDFKFRFFITSKLIRFIYVLAFLFALLAYVSLVVAAFFESTLMGLLGLFIVGPIVFFLLLIYARVILELIMVLFSIAENVEVLSRQDGPAPQVAPSPPASTPAEQAKPVEQAPKAEQAKPVAPPQQPAPVQQVEKVQEEHQAEQKEKEEPEARQAAPAEQDDQTKKDVESQ